MKRRKVNREKVINSLCAAGLLFSMNVFMYIIEEYLPVNSLKINIEAKKLPKAVEYVNGLELMSNSKIIEFFLETNSTLSPEEIECFSGLLKFADEHLTDQEQMISILNNVSGLTIEYVDGDLVGQSRRVIGDYSSSRYHMRCKAAYPLEDIIPHESFHIIFNYKNLNKAIAEGMTTLMTDEYSKYGDNSSYHLEKAVVKSFCELFGANQFLEAVLKGDEAIIDLLTSINGNRDQAIQFLKTLNDYNTVAHLEVDNYLTIEEEIIKRRALAFSIINYFDSYLSTDIDMQTFENVQNHVRKMYNSEYEHPIENKAYFNKSGTLERTKYDSEQSKCVRKLSIPNLNI